MARPVLNPSDYRLQFLRATQQDCRLCGRVLPSGIGYIFAEAGNGAEIALGPSCRTRLDDRPDRLVPNLTTRTLRGRRTGFEKRQVVAAEFVLLHVELAARGFKPLPGSGELVPFARRVREAGASCLSEEDLAALRRAYTAVRHGSVIRPNDAQKKACITMDEEILRVASVYQKLPRVQAKLASIRHYLHRAYFLSDAQIGAVVALSGHHPQGSRLPRHFSMSDPCVTLRPTG